MADQEDVLYEEIDGVFHFHVSKVDLSFKLFERKMFDEKSIISQTKKEWIPLIVDLSINGYSARNEFFHPSEHWTEFKSKCMTNPRHPEQYSIKRAIRVMSHVTRKYIEDNEVKETFLTRKGIKLPVHLAYIGAHYAASDEEIESIVSAYRNFNIDTQGIEKYRKARMTMAKENYPFHKDKILRD